ncbi:MAG: hypothetical protein HC860_07815 [Alkalinema sp. RU_4_3]|nr:hypothetical protein [Alkalinema sp. RU_4_3]
MERRQHYLFTHKYLRDLFHQNPNLFFEQMRSEQGGTYLAQFWQNTAEEFELDNLDIVDATGLNIDYREAADYGLVIILLPPPRISPEACFIGVWANYSNAYRGRDSFRYFTLELKEDVDSVSSQLGESETHMLCEWTADSKHLNSGEIGPTLSGFVRAIEALVMPQDDSKDALDSDRRTQYLYKSNHEFKPITTEQAPISHNNTATVFDGMFKPPTISIQANPVKIAGSGCCEVTPDGLRIQGFKQTAQLGSTQLAIAFLVVFFIGHFIGGMIGWGMKAAGVGLLYSASKGQGTDHKGEKIDLLIPWENVAKASFNKASDVVTIQVANFEFRRSTTRKVNCFFTHLSIPMDC